MGTIKTHPGVIKPQDYNSYQEYLQEFEKERAYLKQTIYQLKKDLETILANRAQQQQDIAGVTANVAKINATVRFDDVRLIA